MYDNVELNRYGYYSLKGDVLVEAKREKIFEEEYYQNVVSKSYSTSYSDEEVEFLRMKNEETAFILKQHINTLEGKTFLDLGCGEGYSIDYFMNIEKMIVKGIDYSSYGILKNEHMIPYFLKDDIDSYLKKCIDDGIKYDVIYSNAVLDMVSDPAKVVEHISKVLNKDGIVYIGVNNNFSALQNDLMERGIIDKEHWMDIPGHPSYFNKEGLENLMKEFGFCCCDMYSNSLIDFNLYNPDTNYWNNPSVGKNCFKSRILQESFLHNISLEDTVELYRILGSMGIGRCLVGVFKLDDKIIEKENNNIQM